ncbi:MAG: FHA domain-containing protein, partial [Gammaproteobacteria bacterium]
SLDPIEDSYFSDALRPEYEVYRDKALERADQAFQEARAAWKRYQENGRIMGLQRLEAKISKKFRDQAKQLTKAYTRTQQGMEIYSLLKINSTVDQAEIHKAILQECRLQIRSMRALGMVLEPKLLQDKIKLLPDPDLSPGKSS